MRKAHSLGCCSVGDRYSLFSLFVFVIIRNMQNYDPFMLAVFPDNYHYSSLLLKKTYLWIYDCLDEHCSQRLCVLWFLIHNSPQSVSLPHFRTSGATLEIFPWLFWTSPASCSGPRRPDPNTLRNNQQYELCSEHLLFWFLFIANIRLLLLHQ